jgi:hypothetical protein
MKNLNILLKAILRLFLFSLLLFGLHFYVNQNYFQTTFDILDIHLFFLIINFFLVISFFIVANKWTDKTGFLFMGFFLIKGIFMITFLLIYREKHDLNTAFVLHFFFVYFTHLLFSIYNCVKILNVYIKND